MSYSVNEIMKLAERAARGAGFPPAQADSFGQAVVAHLGAGDSATALTSALNDPTDSPILRLALLPEDILRAARLMGDQIVLTLHPGDEVLAKAYAALVPLQVTAMHIDTPDGGQPQLHLTLGQTRSAAPALPARIDADPDLVATLTTLAQRTYVPASDASRAAAGAGDIDNT